MSGRSRFRDLDFSFFILFLLSVPFSVTISQAFAIFSILSYFVVRFSNFKDFPYLFWLLLGLYLSLLLPYLWNPITFVSQAQSITLKSEFSDFWMVFILLPARHFTKYQKTKIKKCILISAMLLVLAGVISTFFPYRLSTFFMDGFRYIEGRRLPHQIGILNFLQLRLFLPIGFQNTHLTYGALLALFTPSIFFHCYRLIKTQMKGKKSILTIFFFLILSLSALLLLLLNQSRSIWLGLILSFVFLNKNLLNIEFFIDHFKKILTSIFFFLAFVCFLFQTNWLFERSITQIFKKQTLENQRVWIHKANLKIIEDSHFLGIGAGRYKENFQSSYVPLIIEKPYLFYEISITPKSHAHHDFLQFLLLGGLFSATIFICVWISMIQNIIKVGKKYFLFLGIYAIFVAGFFQCFMLDDESFLPLLAFVSLLPNHFTLPNRKSSLIVIIPLLLSLFQIYNLTRISEEDLFIHRTRTANNFLDATSQKTINGKSTSINVSSSNAYYFKLEGCLSHHTNFIGKPSKRKIPFHFKLETEKYSNKEISPIGYEIEIRRRDSFDQDMKFQVHTETVIRTLTGGFNSNITPISIEVPVAPEDNVIYFYDFGIKYLYQNDQNEKLMPVLRIKENCD